MYKNIKPCVLVHKHFPGIIGYDMVLWFYGMILLFVIKPYFKNLFNYLLKESISGFRLANSSGGKLLLFYKGSIIHFKFQTPKLNVQTFQIKWFFKLMCTINHFQHYLWLGSILVAFHSHQVDIFLRKHTKYRTYHCEK